MQNIIDKNEGYINYNDTEDTHINQFISDIQSNMNDGSLPASVNFNVKHNLITNEYCKSLDNENQCNQIKQCKWNIDNCSVNVSETTNKINDYLYSYYIPLPNSHNNELEYDICDYQDESTCNDKVGHCNWNNGICSKINIGATNCGYQDDTACSSDTSCQWTHEKCYKKCNTQPLPPAYEPNPTLSGILSEQNFNSHIECKNLSDGINNIQYSGVPKGICLDDATSNIMTPIGCIDSKELNDLILHKSQDYIDNVVTNAYLTDLTNTIEVSQTGQVDCDADLNGDNMIGVDDLLPLLAAFGSTLDEYDFYGGRRIDADDVLNLLGTYGDNCGAQPVSPTPGSPTPGSNDIGVTTNHNLIVDHLLTNAETCFGDPNNCPIDETKTSKLIDNCRELCENNNDKCNEYGVKFPTSVDDYSNAGCYLSKFCMSSSDSDCIPQPCNTSLTDPYEGCIPPPCNTSLTDPYEGCIPNYTAFPDNYVCNIAVTRGWGGSIGSHGTDTGDDITDNSCRIRCSQLDNCAGYQFNDVTATRTTQQCTIFTGRQDFDGVVTPSEGSYCYRKDV